MVITGITTPGFQLPGNHFYFAPQARFFPPCTFHLHFVENTLRKIEDGYFYM
jgi:hypothetical protein